jgi:RimJ/RimL family protein N-acetyltransferase/ketosteroid isomerase-like protein
VSVVLRPISAAAAEAILAGRAPGDVGVAEDYPTEFSHEVAAQVGRNSPLGPFFVHRAGDDVVVGEIGGSFTAAGVVEIGYAIVPGSWGHGHASAAVGRLLERARGVAGLERIVAHTPLDRPASGRVLEKAGFAAVAELDHEHDGVAMRVVRWELAVDALAALATFDALYELVTRARDGEAGGALFADDASVVMWGSEEDERAVGPAAVRDMLRAIAAGEAELAFRWHERRIQVDGDVAWINASGELGGTPYRTTAVLVRRDGAWRWHTHSGSAPD